MKRSTLMQLTLLALTFFAHDLAAEVVEDTKVSLSARTNIEYRLGVDLTANPNLPAGASLEFQWNNGDVLGAPSIDPGIGFFSVFAGDELSSRTLGAPGLGSFPNSQFPSFLNTPLTLDVGDEFFVGMATEPYEQDFEQFGISYGWAKFQVTGTQQNQQLVMLDNVMAFCGDGIFVGTTEIVPEPVSSLLLIGVLGCVMMFRKRRYVCRAAS